MTIKIVHSNHDQQVPTLGELRAAIPAHCFKHSMSKAFGLVVRDGLIMAALLAVALAMLPLPGEPGSPLNLFHWLGWAVYGFAQGTAAIGWWVLAHECGHGGFTQSRWINDSVGWVLHSFLLVPYFAWQSSHAKHHSKTNHLLDGESHVPDTHEELTKMGFAWVHHTFGDDCFAIIELFNHLVVGWPMYLLFNVTGGRRLKGQPLEKPFVGLVDHFRPNSPLFSDKLRPRIFISTLGIMITLVSLGWAAQRFGTAPILVCYFVPYLWCNAWLVLYTWLQHTDPSLPHYGESDWTWVKGALSTIDRPYTLFDWFHHHIGSTHVCHHVFSTLPCITQSRRPSISKRSSNLVVCTTTMQRHGRWLLGGWQNIATSFRASRACSITSPSPRCRRARLARSRVEPLLSSTALQ